ncbi:tubby-related protein 4 [Anabrus simplex]|uniref:tubby-related protein 4 n=1 Tax=Anabrus simplex TaxID=316456 RepID=UPI0035A35E9B
MHLHFERNTNAKCDCTVLSLTWMGKVPDELPEDEGWKLNRTNYYQEGWLATGNVRGIVGVTFTTSHCKKSAESPLRSNYNLRGHRSEVILVKWNEPYQKLASCDSTGIIFVWIKYEGRWSIELINDRSTPVTHFSWSHDGRMALICYQDGFVLVGSVAGQRYWSSMLNLDSTITCGIWTPDDQQVYFGTTAGQIIVMDVHGAMVSQVQLSTEVGITGMAWSCEKFKMEEGDEADPVGTQPDDRIFILAVSLKNGYIFLMKSYDDVSPVQVHTGLGGSLCLEWSNSRELLAVAGTVPQVSLAPCAEPKGALEYTNMLKFYSDTGVLLYSTVIPYTQSPVTAMTWGHNDKRLFVATGCQVHIAWVSRRVASLQLMCRLRIHSQLRGGEPQVAALPLPPRMKALIANLFAQTIRCCVPESSALREFVSRPPVGSVRLHCTMIRHDDDSNLSSGTCYTLYLEYLGGLVPLLKGKRTSKIRPEFVIFDPQVDELALGLDASESAKSSGSSQNAPSDTSDTEREDGCGSPRVQRRKRKRNKSHGGGEKTNNGVGNSEGEHHDDLTYVDSLPEHIRLVEVTSNIWGTKFKIHGLATSVPANLGQVTYKTSLLHLQPRQMTLVITELRDDFPPGPDPNFNPNLFSEDEEEVFQQEETHRFHPGLQSDSAPPIAPMTPRPHHPASTVGGRFIQPRPPSTVMMQPPYSTSSETRPVKTQPQMHHITAETNTMVNGSSGPSLAKAESYEDEFPYVDLTDISHFCETLRTTAASSSTTTATVVSPTVKSYLDSCACPQVLPTSNGASSNGYTVGGISQFSRSNIPAGGAAPGQARHAISPLVCDGAVPALQSPKNAVAPSEVLIERPPSAQTMMASSTPIDYSSNVQRMKSALVEQNQNRGTGGLNLNLNLGSGEQNNIDLRPVVVKRLDVDGNSNNKLHQLINSGGSNSMCSGQDSSVVMATNAHNAVSPHSKGGKRKEKHGSSKSSPSGNQVGVAAGKWCVTKPEEFMYIDEEGTAVEASAADRGNFKRTPTAMPIGPQTPTCLADSMVRSCSVGYLDLVDAQMVPCDVALLMLRKETPKRLVLVNRKRQKRHKTKTEQNQEGGEKSVNNPNNSPKLPKLKHCGKSKSLDSSDIFPAAENASAKSSANPPSDSSKVQAVKSPKSESRSSSQPANSACSSIPNVTQMSVKPSTCPKGSKQGENTEETAAKSTVADAKAGSKSAREEQVGTAPSAQVMANLAVLDSLRERIRDMDDTHSLPPPSPCASPRLPRSSPASPAPSKKASKRNQSSSPIRKHLLNSPLLNRRQRKSKTTESSDDEVVHSGDEVFNGKNYRDLESFQKAQLKQKLKRGKCKGDGPEGSPTPQTPRRREFVMHNKAPMWNENSQVYQLDFGGRVTQESAKNFQIEFRGKQVMQFGRIDGNAYTLDFQYPFSALQAFAVALANVTQRLK